MTRWMIEKDGTGIEKSGTGIEKSGTGIEKSGTGIEKSGTGIEKSGTGIEKSGTGIRKGLLALSLASLAFTAQLSANELRPEGNLNLVVQNDSILVSWFIDGSVFSGVAALTGTTTNLSLTEISLATEDQYLDTTGGGTGSKASTTGGGTGINTTGGGTGINTTGGGTGINTTGGGTGINTTGGGTGIDTTGGGTGSNSFGASGTIVLTTGGGTGNESIAITLPGSTGLEMEITLGCQTASVSVLDVNYTEVVAFNNIAVMGSTGLCDSGRDSGTPWMGADLSN